MLQLFLSFLLVAAHDVFQGELLLDLDGGVLSVPRRDRLDLREVSLDSPDCYLALPEIFDQVVDFLNGEPALQRRVSVLLGGVRRESRVPKAPDVEVRFELGLGAGGHPQEGVRGSSVRPAHVVHHLNVSVAARGLGVKNVRQESYQAHVVLPGVTLAACAPFLKHVLARHFRRRNSDGFLVLCPRKVDNSLGVPHSAVLGSLLVGFQVLERGEALHAVLRAQIPV
mmetsp:Transcript_14268/g.27495  ORF Transcript_14268/g.27495 Transcript_14268/m.27495 type:complete len:226 (+) Transcript_14268:1548-2225(+)